MNKTDASKYLAIGQRTLERHTSAGRITARRIKTPNGPALDYEEAELERFKREVLEPPEPQVLEPSPKALAPPSPPPMTGAASDATGAALAKIERQVLAQTENGAQGAALALVPVELLARLADVAATVAGRDGKPHVPTADKLLLSLDEAQALTGLSRAHLRAAIGSGSLRAARAGRSWKVTRENLASYLAEAFR